MTGAVLSILKSALVTPVAVLPARSVQGSEVTVTAKPSPVVVLDWALPGKAEAQAALGPEMPASRLNSLVTSVLYQPLPFGRVVGPSSLMTGAVLSILIGPTLRGVVGVSGIVDALTVAGDGRTGCLGGEELVVTGDGVDVDAQLDQPMSAQVNITQDMVLFQPLALAPGLGRPLMTGAIWSTRISSPVVWALSLPAVSVTAAVARRSSTVPSEQPVRVMS